GVRRLVAAFVLYRQKAATSRRTPKKDSQKHVPFTMNPLQKPEHLGILREVDKGPLHATHAHSLEARRRAAPADRHADPALRAKGPPPRRPEAGARRPRAGRET